MKLLSDNHLNLKRLAKTCFMVNKKWEKWYALKEQIGGGPKHENASISGLQTQKIRLNSLGQYLLIKCLGTRSWLEGTRGWLLKLCLVQSFWCRLLMFIGRTERPHALIMMIFILFWIGIIVRRITILIYMRKKFWNGKIKLGVLAKKFAKSRPGWAKHMIYIK